MNTSGDFSEAMLAGLFEEPPGAARAAGRPWQHRTWWTVTAGRGRSEAA
jgi:hypothetical protein